MSPSHSERSVLAVAAGARIGGLVLALGYLTGLVSGPLVAAVGGLALVTFGRSLRMDRESQALAAAGLAVVAGALGIAALRWGSLELAELRSVQGVLGPTILVGPEPVATAAIISTVAATLALALWVAALPVRGFVQWTWTSLETLAMSLALVTAFWGPKILLGSPDVPVSDVVDSLGAWAGASTVVTLAGVGGGVLARTLAVPVRTGVMIAALLALAIAAGLMGSM